MPAAATIDARLNGYPFKWRATRARPIQLTDRDVEILGAIHRYRVLHRQHICDLFFFGHSEEGSSARRRLAQLYEHGYLERIPRFAVQPMANPGPAYRLAARGASLLAECEGIPYAEFNYWGKTEDKFNRIGVVGHSHLEHNLLLASGRMHFEAEAPKANAKILLWLDSFDLRPSWETQRVKIEPVPGRTEFVPVTPDAYVTIGTAKGRGHFFLELDRGTEVISRHWRRKILTYSAYLNSGKFHEHYGVDGSVGFRVLVLTPSKQRSQNIAAAAADRSSMFMLTETNLFLADWNP